LGLLAGALGLGGCVYPVGLVLLGLSSATAAVDLGNSLYGEWGWAFKGAAVVFGGAAVLIQWRRAKACSIDARPNIARATVWLGGVGVATYFALYLATKLLSSLS
jgi:hypothetical protein